LKEFPTFGDDEEDFKEGRILTRVHKQRERKSGLRKKVIKRLKERDLL